MPRIDDERTIEDHAGSILPYTGRRRLERRARLSSETDKEACYRELLGPYRDQWTYWKGLVDSSCVAMDDDKDTTAMADVEGWERCRSFAKEVISEVERNGNRPPRGPYLISVELASMRVRHGEANAIPSLREEICDYGNRFGPTASCLLR